jgi:hypothetical protein
LTTTTVEVLCDYAAMICRVAGLTNAGTNVRHFSQRFRWPLNKAERMWVGVQDAQSLDFQAACIDIVETFFNLFSNDIAAELQELRERGMVDPEIIADIEANAALPYSDFLSELKTFLGGFNVAASRISAIYHLLSQVQDERRKASAEQRARMIHTLKEALQNVKPTRGENMRFALGREPVCQPIPLRPLIVQNQPQDIRQVFLDKGVLNLTPAGNTTSDLRRLNMVGGVADFTPIHELMDFQYPAGVVEVGNLARPSYVSPDQKGAELQERILAVAVAHNLGVTFTTSDAVQNWFALQLAGDVIAPVK